MLAYFCKITQDQLREPICCKYFDEKSLKANNDEQKAIVVTEKRLLSYALVNCGIETKNVEISTTQDGKPFFVGELQNLHFNFSHSGEYVGLAISKNEVGLDLQKKQDVNQSTLRFFQNEVSKEEFCEQFCKFESFAKLCGLGVIKARKINDEGVFYRQGYLSDKTYCFSVASYVDENVQVLEL